VRRGLSTPAHGPPLASVTSLPELVTGIGSVAVYPLPGIAPCDFLGSCMFNLLILAMFDINRRGSPITSVAHEGHVPMASYLLFRL
jgi:cation:H+ antiporter